ncbi:MAG: hypothetical protein A3F74_09220 [Betaproteobacteria bacterium RIFCSPLOWO2_12_FULL_62_58]|nr:MAG: hypothetical protein A3F74_09220 [Betaproteobacteria bacterium RIFCSPLOWO2_12_FULL_62_58]
MADIDAETRTAVPPESLVRLTHVIYGLHAFSAVMGMLGPAFIVTAFLTGWPSIIAVIINYVKRGDARGTFLDSHFGWQIRTFWYALLWVLVMVALILTIVGIPFVWLMGVIVGIWVLYRIARGWITLNDGRAMPA